jgi:glutaredoxin
MAEDCQMSLEQTATRPMSTAPAVQPRPEISVYWKPGCSICLKLKEFCEQQGVAFESVNLAATPDRMDEIMAAGLRSIPVVRRGERFSYAQSLDDVAAFLGVERRHTRLPEPELLDRWELILTQARQVVRGFSVEMLQRPAIALRERPVRDLCAHVFQIVDAFIKTVDDGVTDHRPLMKPREDVATKDQLLAYVDEALDRYRVWREGLRSQRLPERLVTYYGDQPSGVVLERSVWHSAQHARQLDVVAAGAGAEFQIDPALYAGLPMPERLWA